MSLTLAQSKTALAPKLTASFLATGGTAPYTYAVLANGAGGSIDSSSGLYTAPAVAQSDPKKAYDTIQVTDSATPTPATITAQILVGNPLLLLCEIIQQELGLTAGHAFIWDQKVFQPTDNLLYAAVSVPSCKPFASNVKPAMVGGVADWSQAEQVANMLATVDIDLMSRGPDARDRKEELILAINSIYAQAQQEANSFYIGKLPPGSRFVNLSMIDGAAIPYRFKISFNMQYTVTKSKAVPYFDTFQTEQVTTNP